MQGGLQAWAAPAHGWDPSLPPSRTERHAIVTQGPAFRVGGETVPMPRGFRELPQWKWKWKESGNFPFHNDFGNTVFINTEIIVEGEPED